LARIALKRLGLIGKGIERDRRPTESEIDALIALFDSNKRQIIPVGRIIRFAIATPCVWTRYAGPTGPM
jgi:hypothetical protein